MRWEERKRGGEWANTTTRQSALMSGSWWRAANSEIRSASEQDLETIERLNASGSLRKGPDA
jgi:hypothetical protein